MIIEKTLIAYLTDKTGAGASVFAERPNDPPEKYILIEKTGSSVENMITTSTIAIQSISDSMQGGSMLDAMDLNEDVKDMMAYLEELDSIVKVDLNSDYNYTDDSTKEYRYQAVYQIIHY